MLLILKPVASLLFGAALLMLGNSLLGITLPLKMSEAGFSTEATGIIMAAYFAGLLLGSIYGKQLIMSVGHIRSFAGFAAISAAMILVHALLFEAVVWGALRFISGFCIAGLFAVMESWIHERTSNEMRGRILAVYMINYYFAIILGQLMVNLWDLSGVEPYLMAALILCLSSVPVALTKVEAPDLSNVEPMSPRELYEASPLAVVGCVASGAMMGSFWALGAIFAREIGLSVFDVSLFMAAVICGGLALQWPIGHYSDRIDRRHALLAMLVLIVVISLAAVAVTLMGGKLMAFLVLAVLFGGAVTSIYPIAQAQALDYLPRERYIGATSGLLLAYGVGAVIGPVVCSFAMGAIGPYAFFGFMAVIASGLGGFVFHRMISRDSLPTEEQEAFVAMPRMSPVVAEMDPRYEEGDESVGVSEESIGRR